MGKKKQRAKYTSKGQRASMDRSPLKAIHRERTSIEVTIIKQKAWLEGKNPWIVVDNPNPNETNKRKIRVRANQLWGDPKKNYFVFSRDRELA